MEKPFLPVATVDKVLAGLIRSGTPAVLATVIEAEGSAPQSAGAAAVITAAGLAAGTVGGGRVEADVLEAAAAALRTGRSRILSFDLGADYSEDADAICGGRMRVLLDARPERSREALEALLRAASRRGSGVLSVVVKPAGRGVSVGRSWIPAPELKKKTARNSPAHPAADAAWKEKKPRLAASGNGFVYCEPRFPKPRLIIAGAGHVGRAVARLGDFLGFEAIVIDDRPELLRPDLIPGAARLIRGTIALEASRFRGDPNAFIVIVTRGHRRDAETLRACLRGRARYIGMIGSGRKTALLREAFLAHGWATAAEWARVRTPIGLPIGSRTVEEIAVSIAAELVAVRSGRL